MRSTSQNRRGVILLYSSLLAGALVVSQVGLHAASAQLGDTVIFRHRTAQSLWGGRYSVFAEFQKQLQNLLTACGKPTPYVVSPGTDPDGKIGDATKNGIIRALQCPALAHVPGNSRAREGAITASVWSAVIASKPVPTLSERIDALVLTFEGTDFGRPPEWNFCESNPNDDPHKPGFVCINKVDPCSLVTWGPRGATAGGGREVQWVLWLARQENQTLVDQAFGVEAPAMQRFLRLKGDHAFQCPGDPSVEKFLCTVWMTPTRKAVWTDALTRLGTSSQVQAVYNKLYASDDFDGGKVKRFFRFWGELGLTATQADYAYFVDRATQTGGPDHHEAIFQNQVAEVRACMSQEPSTVNANARARRCYSLKNRGGAHRLARDVAFYKDVYPSLTDLENSEWFTYKTLTISDLSISDDAPFGSYTAPPIGTAGPTDDSDDLTDEEKAACPATILNPVRN